MLVLGLSFFLRSMVKLQQIEDSRPKRRDQYLGGLSCSRPTKFSFYFNRLNISRSMFFAYLQWAPVRSEAQMELYTFTSALLHLLSTAFALCDGINLGLECCGLSNITAYNLLHGNMHNKAKWRSRCMSVLAGRDMPVTPAKLHARRRGRKISLLTCIVARH